MLAIWIHINYVLQSFVVDLNGFFFQWSKWSLSFTEHVIVTQCQRINIQQTIFHKCKHHVFWLWSRIWNFRPILYTNTHTKSAQWNTIDRSVRWKNEHVNCESKMYLCLGFVSHSIRFWSIDVIFHTKWISDLVFVYKWEKYQHFFSLIFLIRITSITQNKRYCWIATLLDKIETIYGKWSKAEREVSIHKNLKKTI